MNSELALADGSKTTMGLYLSEVLPRLLEAFAQQNKSQMESCMQLLQLSIQRFPDHDKALLNDIAALRWKDGSMERYWGPEADFLKRMSTIPKRYFEPSMLDDGDVYCGFNVATRQRYQAAISNQSYKEALAQIMSVVEDGMAGKPIEYDAEGLFYTESFSRNKVLEVLFNVANLPEEEVDIDDILDTRVIETYANALALSKKIHSAAPVDKKNIPADTEAFCKKFHQFALQIRRVLSSPAQGQHHS